ncbi:recombinase family protein [Clostridium sp. Mt-5]|uniref:Recombinase family protein n=1 Tax=Clostridium moutaii TaxID=3240932 RepID=A0ABV4BTX2_9CLOT
MLLAVAYCRFSSDNQREESIDAQLRAIKEYASHNSIEITKVYIDEAKSATTDDRPQFLKMIEDSKSKTFDAIIVHKLDRFSRNRYDSAVYKKKLKDNGVTLISVLEHLDGSPESIILESLLEGMAEYYSKNLAREVMKGMKETALQCKHTGGKSPLGYDISPDKTYIINETEAQIVKLIFKMYVDGFSYAKIINKLNIEGYKTKKGKLFGKNSIYSILSNEKYCGTYVFNRSSKKVNGKRNNNKSKSDDEIIRIKGGMPRIISDEVWNIVKNKMVANKRKSASYGAKEIYLLSGIIFCGKCGGAMVGNRRYAGRNKTLYCAYECSTRKRNHTCDAKSINKEFVEEAVINQLIHDLFAPEAMDKIVDKVIDYAEAQSSHIKDDIKQLESELTSIQNQIDNIVNAIAGGMFYSSMKEKMDNLEARKSKIAIELEEAKRQQKINLPSRKLVKSYIQKDADIKEKSPEEQKRIIQTYVKKVIVYEDTIETNTIVDLKLFPSPPPILIT